MAATGSMDSTARLWNVSTGSPLAILSDHDGEIISVAFNSAGDLVLTGSFDRTARVWDVRTGKCVHRLEGHNGEVRPHEFVIGK
jgi:dynein assembly factor with WDR repeat domains 1